jgi:ABC-type sugar transport system permease subunit
MNHPSCLTNEGMLLAPTALFTLAVTVFPLGYAIVASLQAYRFGRPVAFIDLLNYQNLLADANFRGSIVTTLIFTGAATTGSALIKAEASPPNTLM